MNISNLIYFLELVITIIVLLVGFIIVILKHKNWYLKFLGITVSVLVCVLILTFVFERPSIHEDIKNLDTQGKIIIEASTQEKLKKPTTIYHFKDVTDKVRIIGNIDYNKLGEYEIVYEVDTLIGVYTQKAVIKTVDTTAPKITLSGGEEYHQSYSKEYEDPGYKAIDLHDGDITDKVETEIQEINTNTFNVKYKVKDSSGNATEKIRQVVIVDDVKPVITLNGYENTTIYLGENYEEKGAKAEDESDGDLTNKIVIEGNVDTSKEGNYIISYKVVDNSGNEAVKQRKVTVVKEEKLNPLLRQENTNTSAGNKVIYLTFDDGPSSYTNKLLDILKAYNVKATFFVTGNGRDEVIKREYDEGHTVALHTNSHNYSYVYSSVNNFFTDLYAVQSRVENITGHKSYIMRFPGGSSNTISQNYDGGTKIMSYLTKEVQKRGFRYFDWNVSSGDAGGTTTTEGVFNNVTVQLKEGRSVVLQHDIKEFSVEAVPSIIEYGLENGYTFEKITMDTPMVTHRVNN